MDDVTLFLRKNFNTYTSKYTPTLLNDEVWDYYLNLFDNPLQLKKEWSEWISCFSEFESHTSFFSEINHVCDQIIQDLSFFVCPNVNKIKPPIVKDGRYFSIDLKEGMVQVYKKNGIISENTWSDFVNKYDTRKYFKTKRFRLAVCASACGNSSCDWIYSEYPEIMNSILSNNEPIILWLNNHGCKLSYIVSDSLLFNIPDDETFNLLVEKTNEKFVLDSGIEVHLDIIERESFILNDDLYFYSLKSYLYNTFAFKSENKNIKFYLPQLYKKLYYKTPIDEIDLYYGIGEDVQKYNNEIKIEKIYGCGDTICQYGRC